MKKKILFVERKASESVSIERVFEQIAKDLPKDRFESEVQQVAYGNGIFGTLMNLLFFRPRQADIYHITGHVHYIALRLPKKKTVLTIHDLIFLHRRNGPRRFILKWLFLTLPMKRLDNVTAVSQSTKEEIQAYTSVNGERIRVIEDPLIDGFQRGAGKPFDHDHPVILHIGTALNKNLPNLIRALRGMRCKLRIIGKLDPSLRETLHSNKVEYENVCGLDQAQMAEEYREADIVAFCSTYEGFGLPIIEAQAMGRSVVTSDLSPMKDVAGGGAVLVDPHNTESIRNGILKLIEDADLRNHLVDIGETNVERFASKKIASQYAELYDKILANG